MSLSGAIAEIQTRALTITGIKAAPTNPPETMNQFPFAVTYARTVRYTPYSDWKTTRSTIVTEIHFSRQNLPTAIAASVDIAESFATVIFADKTLAGNCNAIPEIRAEYGFLAWGADDNVHIGWRFEMDLTGTSPE